MGVSIQAGHRQDLRPQAGEENSLPSAKREPRTG